MLFMHNPVRAQASLIDSTFEYIFAAEHPYKKALRLENSLQYFVGLGFTSDTLEPYIQFEKLTPQMVLMLESYTARKLISLGEYESLISQSKSLNPYIQFQIGNACYFTGDEMEAISSWKKAISLSNNNIDSSLYSSLLNNIGAVYWGTNFLDSALVYFMKAKEFTFWHNEMLEANILAIANTLGEYETSKQSISSILEKDPDTKNGVFFSNLRYYYSSTNPDKIDSLDTYIISLFNHLSEVEDALLPVYLDNDIFTDSLFVRVSEMKPTYLFERALESMLLSSVMYSRAVTDDALIELMERVKDEKQKTKLSIFLGTDSIQKYNRIQMLRNSSIENEESVQNLRNTANEFKLDLEQAKSSNRRVFIGGLLIVLFIVTIVLIQQRSIVIKSRENAVTSQKNNSLQEQNADLATELKSLRNTIKQITSKSLKQSKDLMNWITEFNATEEKLTVSEIDMNSLISYNNGLLRFKIIEFCHQMNTAEFIKFEKLLSEVELNILKLTVLGFKSKEVSTLIDITPQYVNNIRSKLKSKLEEMGYDYNTILGELRNSLSEETV